MLRRRLFSEIIGGPGAWPKLPATVRQTWRDNSYTLLGPVNEQRAPFTRQDAESLRVPTLFIGGTDSPGTFSTVLRARFCAVVIEFSQNKVGTR